MNCEDNFLRQSIGTHLNIEKFCEKFHHFWEENPCLLYGLSFLLADSFIINFNYVLFFPLFALLFPLLLWKYSSKILIQKLLLATLLFVVSLSFFSSSILIPHLKTPIKGKAIFSIQSFQESSNSFGNKWIYKGNLHRFINKDNKVIAKNIPCTILVKASKDDRPSAYNNYIVEGELNKNQDLHHFFFRTYGKWEPLQKNYSLAELRFKFKNWMNSYIDSFILNTRSALFLKGICTGEFNDIEMKYEFSRFGLQHIMAISGFHFSIIASFFQFLLSFFFPRKQTATFLILILCTYFLFLGPNPSVIRAWIMIFIIILGTILEQKSKPLNSLGIALFAILTYDPLLIKHLGFQFSIAVTLAILSLYQIFDSYMQYLFPKKKLFQAIEMTLLDKQGYCLLTWIRKAFSLSFAVNLVALPMSLFYFNKFPLLALVFNWFFPFLVSLSIIFLIFGLLLFFIPPFAMAIHYINSSYTFFILNYVYNLPKNFDVYLRYHVSFNNLIIFLTIIFVMAILFRKFKNEEKDFAFI